jgi:hypothetical protein
MLLQAVLLDAAIFATEKAIRVTDKNVDESFWIIYFASKNARSVLLRSASMLPP